MKVKDNLIAVLRYVGTFLLDVALFLIIQKVFWLFVPRLYIGPIPDYYFALSLTFTYFVHCLIIDPRLRAGWWIPVRSYIAGVIGCVLALYLLPWVLDEEIPKLFAFLFYFIIIKDVRNDVRKKLKDL
ncbi:hypothetical protein GR11A_00187 [Vibrio phage vB_VcorM_GR11A]|nr:hypothetical protein GR11A_00187 [Vibrio phage vB_VcorM_GR11A]